MSYQYNNIYKDLIKKQTVQDLALGERINYQYDAQMNNYQNRINQNDYQLGLGSMAYANKGQDFAKYNAIVSQQLYRPSIMTVQQQKAKDAASRYQFKGEVPAGYESVLFRPQTCPTYTNEVQILTNQYQYPKIQEQINRNVEAGQLYENQYGFRKEFQKQKNQIYQNMINSYRIASQQNQPLNYNTQERTVNKQQVAKNVKTLMKQVQQSRRN